MPMPSPGSPPGMTASKSSKSSSFHSFSSDDSSVLADASHFEDIGLDDDAAHYDRDTQIKMAPNPYSASYSSDLRAASLKHASTPRVHTSSRDLSKTRALAAQRDITSAPKFRPPFPSLKTQVRSANVRSTSTNQLLSEAYISPLSARPMTSRSSSSLSLSRRRRSPSPSLSLTPKDPNMLIKPRRSSWQSNRERKTIVELEHECDEDDGDDIPDGLILDNVPISPRPPQERAKSQPSSTSVSPDRAPKERVRSVGNGTPPVAVAQGSLRSPTWKSDTMVTVTKSAHSSGAPSPIKMRAKSWTAALADLNLEAKQLTEKLEEHADEVDHKAQRSSTGSMPVRRSSDHYDSKPRHKSALPELPPLRRTNHMIDPLPISKEKEAVLSRTRPSWLPPKDPAEERRHLREYQKMMAQSAEAERRREAAKRAMSQCRDVAADSIMHIWENDIVPCWNEAIREKRTRELWWRGIAPRSRGVVWSKAIGNELGLSETSYKAALSRARESTARVAAGNGTVEDQKHSAWFSSIQQDVEEKTWQDLRIFQKGGPLSQALVDVLSAYAMYRSDIGYVTGCNVSRSSQGCLILPLCHAICANTVSDNCCPSAPQSLEPACRFHSPCKHPQPPASAELLRV